jgi:hypothetical protein
MRGRGARFLGRISDWFFAPAPLHAMVLNRIVLGGVLFLHAASRLPEFDVVYGGDSGAWSAPYREFVDVVLGREMALPLLPAVSVLAGLAPPLRDLLVQGLYGTLLVSSLAFLLGFRTRSAGCIAVALHVLFLGVHPLADWSWAQIIVPFTLYVVLSRSGDAVSIDDWRRRRRGEPARPRMAPAWPMRLLQVHVTAMYFHAGFARIDDPGWLSGGTLFEALSSATFGRFDVDWYAWKPVLIPLCYAAFLLEPIATFALWIPRLRTACALSLLAMHLTLEVLTNVGWWNFVMAGGLACFLPTAWLERLLPGSLRLVVDLAPNDRTVPIRQECPDL